MYYMGLEKESVLRRHSNPWRPIQGRLLWGNDVWVRSESWLEINQVGWSEGRERKRCRVTRMFSLGKPHPLCCRMGKPQCVLPILPTDDDYVPWHRKYPDLASSSSLLRISFPMCTAVFSSGFFQKCYDCLENLIYSCCVILSPVSDLNLKFF